VAIPPAPDLESLVRDYRGRDAVSQGEQFDTNPEQIEARTLRSHLEGIKIALLPKKTRGETVRLRLTLRYGDENNLRGLRTACSLLPSLMTRGTKTRTWQQLQDELDKNQIRLTSRGVTGSASFYVETKRQHLLAAVSLLQEVLRQPRLEGSEFEVLRQEQLTSWETSQTSPRDLAEISLSRTLWPYDAQNVRYVPTIAEQINDFRRLSIEQVRQLYSEYLGAAAGELVVVGDFEPDSLLTSCEKMLSGWTPAKSFQRISRPALTDVGGAKQSIQTPGKENAVYAGGFVIPMSDSHPDYAALLIGNHILGSSGLSSRLGDRVRQQEGLSYGVGSSFSASHRDPSGEFKVYAIANPTNMDRVVIAIDEELRRLVDNGPSGEELAEAKQGFLQRRELRRNDDRYLASFLARTLDADRTMAFYAKQEDAIRQLTREQVQQALSKHFAPDRLVVITAGDFEE
jgi:zinc protease